MRISMKKLIPMLAALLICCMMLPAVAFAQQYDDRDLHIENITFIPVVKNASGNGYTKIGQEIKVEKAPCFCKTPSNDVQNLRFTYLKEIYDQLMEQDALDGYKLVEWGNNYKRFQEGITWDTIDKILHPTTTGETAVYKNNEEFYFIFAAKPKYTITYTDGVDNAVIFEDQVHRNVLEGSATPQFDNGVDDTHIPKRDGYTFDGWDPTVAATVTKTATYTAQWKKNPTPTLPTDDDLKDLLGSVKVSCTNADVSHSAKAYDLLADSYTADLKEVTDGIYTDGIYIVELTVRSAQYVALFNQDHGAEHTLVSDAQAKVYLVYDWDSNSWKLDMPAEADANASAFGIEFKVVCTTPTSDPTSEPTPKPTPIPGGGNGNGGTVSGGPGSSAPSGSSSSLPKTGDASVLTLYVLLLAASVAALYLTRRSKMNSVNH